MEGNHFSLSEGEKQKIIEFSRGVRTRYPREKSIPEVFLEMVSKYGKKIALSSSTGTMTYEQLNQSANKLACHLQKLGVKKGSFVGISMERCNDLIVAILGILKAGGVYVPIDKSYPEERKRFMIEDAGLKIVLQEHSFPVDIVSGEALNLKIGPLDLAYINYTSGSTGKPKGVEVCHRGVLRLVKNTDWIEISPDDRFSQISNISFDASTFEIWGALLNGATLCLYPPGHLSAEGLGHFLLQEKITILDLPSRLFALMVDEQLDSLKNLRVICPGGDVLSASHAKKAFEALPDCKIINTYGPTENTTNTTAYLIKDSQAIEKEVPIGKPISNTSVYILDPEQRLVPVGVPGELCTGGDGLAKGYLHRDDLTKEKWVKNPYDEGLLYRTGDLAVFLPSGDISFLGRIDAQVKIRGFRIELGEIEESLRNFRDVADCVVIAREDHPGDKKLVAYVVWKKKGNLEDLRAFLGKILPPYMVPTFFIALKKIPLNPNWKVDRSALPIPEIGKNEKTKFNSEREEAIAKVWAKILHVQRVGPEDQFFKLGGDSILAMEMISRLKKELQIEISIDRLFQFPILSDFAEQREVQRVKIPKRKIHSPIPLSFNQEALWLVNKTLPDSKNYSLPFAFRLKGKLDIPRLEKAIENIVERHEILRTRFTDDGVQVIESQVKEFFKIRKNQNCIPDFDLNQTPLFCVELSQLNRDGWLCAFYFHHIIFDGWSAEVFFDELTALYSGKKLPEVPLQYGDFAIWQRTHLNKEIGYWKRVLEGAPDLLELPWDHPRPSRFSGKGNVLKRELPKKLSDELIDFAKQQGSTLFVLLLSAFKVLLHRYSGQDDLVIGTPFANRNGYPLESLIGYFVQIILIRSQLGENLPFEEFLTQTSSRFADAFSHSDIPFEMLVSELNPSRSPSYNPIFQVSFSLEKVSDQILKLDGVEVEPIDLPNKTAKFDLTLTVRQGETFECVMEYCTDLFEMATIERMLSHLQVLLMGIIKNPKQKIGQLPLMSSQEIQRITVDWNRTQTPFPRNQSICPLFEEIAEKFRSRTALRFEEKTMSYEQLNRKANQLARHLVKMGVRKQDFVGLYLERSMDLNVAILAILKAGGVYVPIDASYPMERKLFMIKDASVKLVVTHSQFAKLFPLNLICLDTDQDIIKRYEKTNLELEVDPLDLAYVNYTSGSTGKPKGVQVTHRGVIRLVRNINWDTILEKDRFLQISNISFDAFTYEMWGALLNGACICVFPQKKLSSSAIGKFLVHEKVTQVLFTARLFNVMVENEIESLKGVRCLCSCGEAMSPRHAKMAFESLPLTKVKNTCGHTENTTHTTTYDITDSKSIEHGVPIGRPVSNTTTYILDKHAQPVPIGVLGELYTGGDGVARGYLNREELNREKFVSNPFGEGKLYRTGDLVRYLPDGTIFYIGRIDSQVKLRGFRIELGEIEEILRENEKIADCVVLLRGDQLVAYLEPERGEKVTVEEMREYMGSLVPQYMIPHFFVILKKFPVSPNGKVDRKTLPPPQIAKQKKGRVSFQTETEKVVASIWSEILHIPKIAATDHFFKIGGDSIHAMRLASEIKKKYHFEASIHSVFQNSILSDFAKWVDSQKGIQTESTISKRKTGSPIPLSLNQESLWLLEKFYPHSALYMIPFAFRIKGKIKLIKRSFEKILARHEILRTRFVEKGGVVLQKIENRCPNAFVELEMSEKEALAFIRNKSVEGMDLTRLPLLQLHLIKVRSNVYIGLLRAHHIIFDGWSTGVFFREWLSANRLPKLLIQYGDFALWQRAYLESDAAKKQLKYWERQLSGAPELLELPWDFPRPSQFSGKGGKEVLKLPAKLHASINQLAKSKGVTPFVLTLAAFQVFLRRYSGKDDVLVGTAFANRSRRELQPLIGFFVQMLAIRASVTGTFEELIQQVSQTLSDAYQNGDIPFEKIVEVVNPTRNPSYNPIFQVGFGRESVDIKEIPLELGVSKFDLNLSINKRTLDLEYSADLFEKMTIQRMLRNYQTLLEGMVANPQEQVSLLPILSKEEVHQQVVEFNDSSRRYPRDDSIPTLFEQIAAVQPERVALRFLGKQMSYRELNERANGFAHYLMERGVKKGDFVGLTLDRSFESVIAMLAILKAGAAYVPIDAAYPADRREFMIQNSGIQVHVTQVQAECKKNLGIKVGPLDLAYVNYTSGSTGKPKGVEVTHRGVLRQSKNSAFFECAPKDRILHMASISFDATTTEVWNALLNGACLCIWPNQQFLAEALGKFLREEKITHALFTARVFNLMVEQQLSSLKTLKYLASGGEAMSAHHAKMAFEALPHTQIVNAYGPTENSVCTTVYRIFDLQAIEKTVPIGRPIGNTQVYVLDSNQQLVPLGVHGELYAGGDGVARGYLNRPELTAEKFIPNPFGAGKLYRTGDLAKYLPDGNLVYLGRIDNQVKLRGFRIELGEIEEVLRLQPDVADCIAMVKGDLLIVYVEQKEKSKLSEAALREFCSKKLPKYMIPSFFMILEQFPVTPNGKVDRKALPSPYQTRELELSQSPTTMIEKVIAETWTILLKIPKIGRNDHFFHLGGHSITAAQLSSITTQEFGIPVPVRLIFDHPTLEAYAQKIELLMEGKQVISSRQPFVLWRDGEVILDSSIRPEGHPPDASQYINPKKVFLTGATGFVGAFFLKELIEKTKAKIYCLVRAKNEKEGFSHLKQILTKYLIWKPAFKTRLVIVPGDLSMDLLGIQPKLFEKLAQEIDSIFHIGALVNHVLPYERLKGPNVLGTQETLRLACKTRQKPFHFISTAAVLSPESSEEDFDLNDSGNLFNGYAQSKWVAEKLTLVARSRGLPTSIYRLARVSGDSQTGAGPTGDFLWRVVQASIRLQMAPDISYSEEVSPVDYICKILWKISAMPKQINQQFHLINPHLFSYRNFFKFLKRLGYRLTLTDFDHWRNTIIQTAIETREPELQALVHLFTEMDLYQPEPLILSEDHVIEALKGTGIQCPQINEALLKKYVDYFVKIKFLPKGDKN